ncbi:MAG: hypothetical protein EAY75_07860 [Bacteroidetes bacterium]|nr:MAG: hypothetical protein EAY75_07860 [Bacteroidota bacterium]
MKNLLLTVAVLAGLVAGAQVKTVGQDIVEYNGQKYPCHVYEYANASGLVEDAIKERMMRAGNKTTKGARNWLVYKNVLLPGITEAGLSDVYIKVEEQGKKDNVKSTVYLITTKPNEISDERVKKADRSNSAVNIALLPSGVPFLTSMNELVSSKQFDADLKAQEDAAAKEEKRLVELKDDQRKLEKRIKELQDELAENAKAQERQVQIVATEKAKADAMKATKKAPLPTAN